MEQIPKYPAEPQGPRLDRGADRLRKADRDGKSGHYAEVQRDGALVAKFFVDEKQQLVRQVGGSVDHEAKQNACKGEYYGAVSWGMEKAVQDRLKERSDKASSAMKYIEQNADSFKKSDRTVIEKQARDLALAAYLAYVALPERHADLERLLAEHDGVKKRFPADARSWRPSPPTRVTRPRRSHARKSTTPSSRPRALSLRRRRQPRNASRRARRKSRRLKRPTTMRTTLSTSTCGSRPEAKRARRKPTTQADVRQGRRARTARAVLRTSGVSGYCRSTEACRWSRWAAL